MKVAVLRNPVWTEEFGKPSQEPPSFCPLFSTPACPGGERMQAGGRSTQRPPSPPPPTKVATVNCGGTKARVSLPLRFSAGILIQSKNEGVQAQALSPQHSPRKQRGSLSVPSQLGPLLPTGACPDAPSESPQLHLPSLAFSPLPLHHALEGKDFLFSFLKKSFIYLKGRERVRQSQSQELPVGLPEECRAQAAGPSSAAFLGSRIGNGEAGLSSASTRCQH